MTDSHITADEYTHAENVWKHFKMKTMEDYTKLYLKTDVLLLADVFECFRNECLCTYKLDPAHYMTAPSLTWDAALKMTRVRLERIMDMDMYMFLERGVRGGICQTCLRYAKAEPGSSSIVYLDVTNLYGWSMMQMLPYGRFRWMQKELWNLIGYEGPYSGYILEVDLEYPEALHDLHSDLPLAPEHMNGKLLNTLHHKERYVLHYKNLQLYVSLGMKVKKIHRVLRFDQLPWLKPYVEMNATKRKQARNDFEKNFYKLMVSCYSLYINSLVIVFFCFLGEQFLWEEH